MRENFNKLPLTGPRVLEKRLKIIQSQEQSSSSLRDKTIIKKVFSSKTKNKHSGVSVKEILAHLQYDNLLKWENLIKQVINLVF